MKFLCWNIRGLANPTSRQELANIYSFHKSSLVAISDPITSFNSNSEGYWRSLGIHLVKENAHQPPILWVFVSGLILEPTIINVSTQQIIVFVIINDAICYISFVYASTYYINRRLLLADLTFFAEHVSCPWLRGRF